MSLVKSEEKIFIKKKSPSLKIALRLFVILMERPRLYVKICQKISFRLFNAECFNIYLFSYNLMYLW